MSTNFQTKAAARLNTAASAVVPLLTAAVIAVALTFAGCDSASSGGSAPRVTVTKVEARDQSVVNATDEGVFVDIAVGTSSFALILDNPRGIPLELTLESAPTGGGADIAWSTEKYWEITQDDTGAVVVTISGAAWKDEAVLTLRIAGGGRDFAPYTFTLRCIAPIFTVNFVTEYGSLPPESVSGGNTLRFPPPPAYPYPTGLYLEGWYSDNGHSSRWYFEYDKVMGHTTLYANWASTSGAVKYTVNFDKNGKGTDTDPQTVLHGTFVGKPAPPTEPDWAFGGWYKDSACNDSDEWIFDTHTVLDTNTQDGTLTLYAKWAPVTTDTYDVTFDENGHGSAPAQQPVADGSHATDPGALNDADYDFRGWYKDNAGKYRWDFATDNVTGDMTLYAYWTIKNYTVAFNANGHGSAPASITVPSGGTATPPSDPTAADWLFVDWYTDSACNTGDEWVFSTAINGTNTQDGTLNLYAKWTRNTYTVTFDTQSHGTGTAPIPQTINKDNPVAEPNPPAETGWGFGGWYTDSACNDSDKWDFDTGTVNGTNTTPSGTLTLYAKWTEVCTVSFDMTQGPGMSGPSKPLLKGEKLFESMAPDTDDPVWDFVGWFDAATGGSPWDFDAPITGDVTIHGRWININEADFGAGAAITSTINISSGGTTLYTYLTSIKNTAGNYVVNLSSPIPHDFTGPINLGTGVNISLRQTTGTDTIQLTGTGYSLFDINGTDARLIIRGPTLEGKSGNNTSLVKVTIGSLNLHSGSIQGNTGSIYGGGGVIVLNDGTFNMSGGTISDNSCASFGGGVYVFYGTFNMSSGTISRNSATTSGNGGGVCINDGTFNMSEGTISDNSCTNTGGGVSVISTSGGGTFTMSGGTIDGNKATGGPGGGVFVGTPSIFTKTGGTITGGSALPDNTSTVSMGHAVYVTSGKKRNTTAGPGVNMDSSDGTGWE